MENTEREPDAADDSRSTEESEGTEEAAPNPAVEDEVDEASDQSFPASDPPPY